VDDSWICQTLGVPRLSRGVTLFTYGATRHLPANPFEFLRTSRSSPSRPPKPSRSILDRIVAWDERGDKGKTRRDAGKRVHHGDTEGTEKRTLCNGVERILPRSDRRSSAFICGCFLCVLCASVVKIARVRCLAVPLDCHCGSSRGRCARIQRRLRITGRKSLCGKGLPSLLPGRKRVSWWHGVC
jgi:hypothetical protein